MPDDRATDSDPDDVPVEQVLDDLSHRPRAELQECALPAGHSPPAPETLADVAFVHAVDGDGTALCRPEAPVQQVDDVTWVDVPPSQRCPICAVTLGE
jgi:hypothetical protein